MFVAVVLFASSVLAAPEVDFSVIVIFTSSVLEDSIRQPQGQYKP